MTPVTLAKAALVFAGMAAFLMAIRLGVESLRWLAIAFVATAFLLRFGRRAK